MKKIKISVICLICLIAIFSSSAGAATYYVRPDGGSYGSENGTDWNNAYDGLPATLERGSTYVVAGGAYHDWVLDDDGSGSQLITIRKASASLGDDVISGWQSSFETTQATIDGPDTSYNPAIVIRGPYFTIDGITGSGYGSETYGFKIFHDRTLGTTRSVWWDDTDGDNITVRHVEFESPGPTYNINQLVFSIGNTENLTIEYCWAYSYTGFVHGGNLNTAVIQYNWLGPHERYPGIHGETLAMNNWDELDFRYNYCKQCNDSSGGLLQLGPYTTYPETCTNLRFYGNVFWQANENSTMFGSASSADPQPINGLYIVNNTFIDVDASLSGYSGYPNRITNAVIKNNAYFDTSVTDDDSGQADIQYNLYGGTSANQGSNYVDSSQTIYQVFNDPDNNDYSLISGSDAMDAGTDLGAAYNTDVNGNTRGADGTWDIGAFEYDSGVAPVVTGYDPAKSETGVNKDTNIEFIIYDATNDVDLDTIVMTEESNYHCCSDMVGTCPGSGAKDLTCTDYSVLGDGYTVVYNPGTDYSYEQIINVTIDADDDQGNSMDQDSYSFTIESAPSELTNNGSIMNGCSIE